MRDRQKETRPCLACFIFSLGSTRVRAPTNASGTISTDLCSAPTSFSFEYENNHIKSGQVDQIIRENNSSDKHVRSPTSLRPVNLRDEYLIIGAVLSYRSEDKSLLLRNFMSDILSVPAITK